MSSDMGGLMTEGVLLSKDEPQELTEIRIGVDCVQRMLDGARQADDISVSDAASVLQPITRWLGDFVDKVYKRVGLGIRAKRRSIQAGVPCWITSTPSKS